MGLKKCSLKINDLVRRKAAYCVPNYGEYYAGKPFVIKDMIPYDTLDFLVFDPNGKLHSTEYLELVKEKELQWD